MQSGMNFLEGEVANGDAWTESQQVITDEPKEREQTKNQQKQNQNLDFIIKVSVPDWKVMAFSTEPNGQLVWERQVNICYTIDTITHFEYIQTVALLLLLFSPFVYSEQ